MEGVTSGKHDRQVLPRVSQQEPNNYRDTRKLVSSSFSPQFDDDVTASGSKTTLKVAGFGAGGLIVVRVS